MANAEGENRMVIRKEDMPVSEHSMREGNGLIIDRVIVPKDKMIHARLFSLLTIRQGCSIGYHDHNNEVEYYYVLSGQGIVTEKDGEITVNPGDAVVTGWGAGHSIRNDKEEDLVILASISTEA